MNKIMALILMALLSVAIIYDCYSQDDTEGQELMTIDGKVAKVDVSGSAITVKTAREMTFSVPANATIMNDIYDIKLSDIEPGNDVTVEYYEDLQGKFIATKVTVQNKEI